MKRICYTVSTLLMISWAFTVFMFHAGNVAHTLIFLAVIFLLHGIIVAVPKKIPGQVEEKSILPR